ncbi:MAG: ABC transporter permease [Chloroflexi bacterium]|nr:ABC transporter permease [Chloroflexota bacterium]
MSRYIQIRLLSAIPTLLGVSVAVFFVLHILPGDPVDVMLYEFGASAERMAELREQMGLDKPVWVQYWYFLRDALRGDLGRSLFTNQPITEAILQQLPDTLQLAFAGLFVAVVLGIALGVISALYHNSWLDVTATVYSVLGISMPLFWLGLLAIMLFSLKLRWLPAAGSGTFRQLIMPALVLGFSSAAVISRLVRSSMLEVMRQDYIITARAKGLAERLVIVRHALRNALVPVVTIIGLQFSGLLGGAVITETVFSRRGIGTLAVTAVKGQDFQMVQGTVLFAAAGYVLVNLVVDIFYGFLDPRIRYD